MSYSVYFKYGSKKYKLPVNPEEIKRTRNLNVETYQVLGTGQVSVPSYCELEEYSFEAEFPSRDYHYVEPGARADADYYEKMFRKAQKNKKPIRFIASNDITDDISVMVLVKSVESRISIHKALAGLDSKTIQQSLHIPLTFYALCPPLLISTSSIHSPSLFSRLFRCFSGANLPGISC